jgi:hypothetical protein
MALTHGGVVLPSTASAKRTGMSIEPMAKDFRARSHAFCLSMQPKAHFFYRPGEAQTPCAD